MQSLYLYRYNATYMISIEKAIQLVKSNTKPLLKETTKLVENSLGYLLYNDVYTPINMPPFRQSAMDGYALCLHDELNYRLIGEVKAGDGHELTLNPGEAVRIFTGAPVPDTANAVVMQEHVVTNGDIMTIKNQLSIGHNIRPMGEQVKQGSVALKKGTKLTPPAIGYLTSLGIVEVSVFKSPSIALITTGNELIEAGQELTHGKIYESNSKMLLSALRGLNFEDVSIHKIDDNFEETKSELQSVIKANDLVIVTGGISVGDYDFVGKALNELEVETLFYKVKQKPGKPLFFGKKNDTCIFALPGNPAAALTCFYVYVHIALRTMMNESDVELPRIHGRSKSAFVKKGDRPQFLKAIYYQGNVAILEGQSSSMLQTFALSNALVFVPAEVPNIEINDHVETIVLPI